MEFSKQAEATFYSELPARQLMGAEGHGDFCAHSELPARQLIRLFPILSRRYNSELPARQ